MRKLAHIETVTNIRPIEGCDNIVQCNVLGWNVIVKKDEFKDGDKCVYIEIDSICPSDNPDFAFLEKKHYKIKTMKLRGTISQGIVFPMSILHSDKNFNIGDDVTDLLKITEIEDEVPATRSISKEQKEKQFKAKHKKFFKNPIVKHLMKYSLFRKLVFAFIPKKKSKPTTFPSYIVKTDETRCLDGDVKVETNKGKIRIADIVNKKLNVLVKSYNPLTKKVELKNILSYQKYPCEEDLIKIIYYKNKYGNRQNNIICTKDHKILTDKGYIEANNINVGDTIYNISKSYSNDIIPYIYGMLLGDSGLILENRNTKNGNCVNSAKISFCQGEKQLDYLMLKQQILGKEYLKIRKGKSGYCDNNIYFGTLRYDERISNTLYDDNAIKDRHFVISKDFCAKLTPISLAFWYMDDGTLRHRNNDKIKPTIEISSNAYSKEENELLISTLLNKFNIHSNLRIGKYYSIYITANDTPKFLKMVTKYMPNSMRYKTLPQFETEPFVLSNVSFQKEDSILANKVIDMQYILHSKYSNNKFTYDLEVEDNHNFFANDILTHNCQNMPWVLESCKDVPMIVTEKLDGTSSTFGLQRIKKNKFDFAVCSRNVRQSTPDKICYYADMPNVYWEMAVKYDIENVLKDIQRKYNADTVVIQGETIGEGIQKNKYNIKGHDLYVFNLIINGQRIDSVKARDILKEYGMKFVPILENDYILLDNVDDMIKYADGKSEIYDTLREGVVIRNYDRNVSFKCISNKFLLKHNL